MRKKIKKILVSFLAKWAKREIRRYRPKIIAITGSIAKTSTKEVIFLVMKRKFDKKVGYSPGNLNNEIGMPLAILGIKNAPKLWQWPGTFFKAWLNSWRRREFPEYLILEMGVDKPGDINFLVDIASPDIAVVTAVGASHLATLKTVENVALEKEILVNSLNEGGIAILNEDDGIVKVMANRAKAKVIFFKPEEGDIARGVAKVFGQLFGVCEREIEEIMKSVEVPGRLKILKGVNESIIIDDSYNANPLSMDVALKKLSKLAEDRNCIRKIAVLGDMLDLGDYTKLAHKELIERANQEADVVIGIGEEMKAVKPGLYFKDLRESVIFLLKELKLGDIILIKGSHGMHLDKIVDKLKER